MPPVNQGSRTAMVTWTVVTSFLFVLATIFAIYFYVNSSRDSREVERLKAKFNTIIAEGSLTDPEVTAVQSLRDRPNSGYNTSEGLFFTALQRGKNLAAVASSATTPEDAMSAGTLALAGAMEKTKAVGVNFAAKDLAEAVNLLTDQVVLRSNEASNAKKAADEAVAATTKTRSDADAQIKLLTDQLTDLRGQLEQANANVSTMTAAKDTQLLETAASTDAKLKETQETLNKANVQIAELTNQVKQKAAELDKVQQKLNDIRPDVNKPVTRQADGKVVRLPGNGSCFIDLGSGDQIIPGMTFEVYDRVEGIPPIGDPSNDLNLPKGKASLEVVRVGATSSEARIVRTTPRTALSEGDLVANLVYDRNTKNRFLVYGNFDLARTGKPNPQDAEVVKRLITQWGGELVADVNVDTDFVVLGAEPIIPTLTPEQKQDPIEKAVYDRAVAESEKFSEISAKAREYRIPILNQNRFLYMTGYFELSRR